MDVSRLEALLATALPHIFAAPGAAPSCLGGLEEVEISLIEDAEIARIHGEFMDDPTATDVITFHHGEILASVDTAAREAAARGDVMHRELALYLIHGLLHLHGHTDTEPAPRAAMHAAQEAILEKVWPLGA